MSKLTKTFRTEARQTVTFTYDSGTSHARDIPLNAVGEYRCGGCGSCHSGDLLQAQRHAGGCRKTSEEGSR